MFCRGVPSAPVPLALGVSAPGAPTSLGVPPLPPAAERGVPLLPPAAERGVPLLPPAAERGVPPLPPADRGVAGALDRGVGCRGRGVLEGFGSGGAKPPNPASHSGGAIGASGLMGA